MNPAIENYELLSSMMSQMRAAAAQGEWDHLVELEGQCSKHVEVMKAQDTTTRLDESSRLRKAALIRKILADDADIRNHVEPWMAQLQRIIKNVGQERRLQEAYSAE